MRTRLSLPSHLCTEVERRASIAGRSVDQEYGRLFALGLLHKLLEELAPLFPELGNRALPIKPKAPKRSLRGNGTSLTLTTDTSSVTAPPLDPDAGHDPC
jgi:hypothetical protein